MNGTRWLFPGLIALLLLGVWRTGRHAPAVTPRDAAARPWADPSRQPSANRVSESQAWGGHAGVPAVGAAAESPTAAGGGRSPYGSPVATFSLLGYDPVTGEVGGAVQSRVFCVGNGVLWGEADVGVVATQAYVDVSYGPQCLKLLRDGLTPDKIVEQVLRDDPDPSPDRWPKSARQFAVMTATGDYFAFTGEHATSWAGHAGGKYVTAQGNILAGDEVVKSMVRTFEETQGHLSLRLMAALEAGQQAGGDKRGMQSAAMLIVKKGAGPWLNNDVVLHLQVDDNENPIKELRRLVDKANRLFGLSRKRAPRR